MQWIKKYEEGLSVETIMKSSIDEMVKSEEGGI